MYLTKMVSTMVRRMAYCGMAGGEGRGGGRNIHFRAAVSRVYTRDELLWGLKGKILKPPQVNKYESVSRFLNSEIHRGGGEGRRLQTPPLP